MFLENEHQPIIGHSQYDLARPLDHHHHVLHHDQTATSIGHHQHQSANADHQDDSEGRSTASSPTSIYRDMSGCEDFDLKIPKPAGSAAGGGAGGAGGNKEQKPKKHKCKHCGLECTEKVQYWKHIRTHIKPEQLLECPNCEFATDLKHHYEYHLLNHTGAKPFTCPDCDYKCVSKSMLQSHLKSHSNVFQFQCYDCGYASKYMHSLKQHLKKRDHRPATPLNPDGTPNPDIVIDVVGNRRGPRQNKKQNRHNPYGHQHQQHQQQLQQQQQQQQPVVTAVSSSQEDGGGSSSGGHPSPYSMQQLLQLPSSGAAPPVYPTSAESFMYSMITKRTMSDMADYQAEYLAIKNNNNNNNNTVSVDDKMDLYHQHQQQQQQQQQQHRNAQHHYQQYNNSHAEDAETAVSCGDRTPEPPAVAPAIEQKPSAVAALQAAVETGPLNLSKDSVTPRAAGSSRRKGIACKLERPAVAVAEPPAARQAQAMLQLVDHRHEAATAVAAVKTQDGVSPPPPPQQQHQQVQRQQPSAKEELFQQQQQSLSSPEKDDETHVCHHCDIIFKENIMYSMHMGFHSFRDPFACNLCGEITADKFSFFAHIARVPHS